MSSDVKNELMMPLPESLETLLADRTSTESETTCEDGKSCGWTVEWASDYPLFSPCTPCRKCGSVFTSAEYQRQVMPEEERKVVMLTERLERSCDKCKFSWHESVREVG